MSKPAKFKSPQEMELKINEYFKECDKKGTPYTVPGLAYFLGFASRFSINDYSGMPRYSHTILRAKLKIELQRNELLVNAETKNVNGMKFDLQNNFGWKETQEIDQTNHFPDGIEINFTNKATDE
jgi:hypothetical protein